MLTLFELQYGSFTFLALGKKLKAATMSLISLIRLGLEYSSYDIMITTVLKIGPGWPIQLV